MASILKIKDENGNWIPVPAIQGAPGPAPVKGEDYWTEEDKQEIINEIPLGAGLTRDSDNNICANTGYGSQGTRIINNRIALDPYYARSNWNENNILSYRHIQNKPFYEITAQRLYGLSGGEGREVTNNTELGNSSSMLDINATYEIIWDGVTYIENVWNTTSTSDRVGYAIGGGRGVSPFMPSYNPAPFQITTYYEEAYGVTQYLYLTCNDEEVHTLYLKRLGSIK